jgi:hypothetical protein
MSEPLAAAALEIRCAPPYVGNEDLAQFLIERKNSPVEALPRRHRATPPVIVWVYRQPERRTFYSGACDCAQVYRICAESIEWLIDAVGLQLYEGEVTGSFFICPCMGRFVE